MELDVSDEGWTLSYLNERLELYAQEYNHKLNEVKEKPKPWSSGETKLEKALKTLSAKLSMCITVNPQEMRTVF